MIETRTVTHAVHRTTLTTETSRKDGGKGFLLEVFDTIRANHQVGQLTVQFGVGGSISSVIFEERELIKQNQIEFPENGNGERKMLNLDYNCPKF